MKLAEIYSLIFESKEEYIAQHMGNAIMAAYKEDFSAPEGFDIPEIIQLLKFCDPTRNGQYLRWIANMYAKKEMRFEDDRRVKDLLDRFHRRKLREPGLDILKFKTLNSVYDYIDDAETLDIEANLDNDDDEQTSKKQKQRNIKDDGSLEIYNDGRYSVIQLLTAEAASLYGMGTRWCTTNEYTAKHYLQRGNLYIIFDKKMKFKYQYHPQSGQLMDATDTRIPYSNFPEEVLYSIGEFNPKDIDIIMKNIINDKIRQKRLKDISQAELVFMYDDPGLVVEYGRVTRSRVPRGEPAVLKNSTAIVEYAKDVIKGRWPEGEQVLLKSHDENILSSYVLKVLKSKRWPEAEPIIMKSPTIALTYAQTVLKQRWPQAEPYIFSSIYNMFTVMSYIKLFITERNKYFENMIENSSIRIDDESQRDKLIRDVATVVISYIDKIKLNIGDWEEGESFISKNAERSLAYAMQMQKRFPKGEMKILQYPDLAVKYSIHVLKKPWLDFEDNLKSREYDKFKIPGILQKAVQEYKKAFKYNH